MATVAERPPQASAPTDSPIRAPRRAGPDRAFRLLTLVCGLTVLAILALIAVSMTKQAMPAFRQEGLKFLTSDKWVPAENRFGAAAFIYGTLVISAVALVISLPVSIGLALFLTEVAPRR